MSETAVGRREATALRLGFAALILAIWYVAAWRTGGLFLATPHDIVGRLVESIGSGEFMEYVRPSAYIFAVGAGLGVVVGVPAGLLIGRMKWAYQLTEGSINIFYTTPLVALIPFFLVILGFNNTTKILIVFLFTVLPVVINTAAGTRAVDRDLVELTQTFCAPEWTVWRDVLIPGALPAIVTGLRIGLIHALVGVVLADFYAGASGFGYLIILYSNRFDVEGALVPVLVLAAVGTGIAALLKAMHRRLAPWEAAT